MKSELAVSENGLAVSPAIADGTDQTAQAMGTRDGQIVVRLADAGGLPEGTARFVERVNLGVPTGVPVAQFQVLTRAGMFLELIAENIGAVPGAWDFLQLHDSDGVIINGAVPIDGYEIPLSRDHGVIALNFPVEVANGLVVALSSTQGTFTGAARLVGRFHALTGGG